MKKTRLGTHFRARQLPMTVHWNACFAIWPTRLKFIGAGEREFKKIKTIPELRVHDAYQRHTTPADSTSCRADEECLACFHLRVGSATGLLSTKILICRENTSSTSTRPPYLQTKVSGTKQNVASHLTKCCANCCKRRTQLHQAFPLPRHPKIFRPWFCESKRLVRGLGLAQPPKVMTNDGTIAGRT